MTEVILNSQQALDNHIELLRAKWDVHHYLRVTVKTGKQRSNLQNAALHVYCTQVAEMLNDAGYDFRRSLRQDLEIPWNKDLVKEYLWGAVQLAMTGKKSTTKPTSKEYVQIYDVLNRHVGEKFGISAPWPVKKEKHDD